MRLREHAVEGTFFRGQARTLSFECSLCEGVYISGCLIKNTNYRNYLSDLLCPHLSLSKPSVPPDQFQASGDTCHNQGHESLCPGSEAQKGAQSG